MPVYDYLCEACGVEFEVERPAGATGKVKCKHCASQRTLKVFGAAGIVFKGSGFYVTDAKGSSQDKQADGAASASTPKIEGQSPKAASPQEQPKSPSDKADKPGKTS